MKTLKSIFTVLLLCIMFMSCEKSPTEPTGKTAGEPETDLSATDTYANTFTIQPNETIELNSSIVGFYAWKYVSLTADRSIQVSVNNIVFTPELTAMTMDGIYWENISISNTLNNEPVICSIIIKKFRDG